MILKIEKKSPKDRSTAPLISAEIPGKDETLPTTDTKVPSSAIREDPCGLIEEEILEFFEYLNKKNYIIKYGDEIDIQNRFKKLILKLSSSRPSNCFRTEGNVVYSISSSGSLSGSNGP